MKHHESSRPIGRCKGCCLNLRTHCAAELLPKSVWARGSCKRYNDGALLEQIKAGAGPTGAALAKRKRQARAVLSGTEPHYNGVLDPAKLAGQARRNKG